MSSIIWHRLDDPLPAMKMWGAVQGAYQFILTHDQLHSSFAASVKRFPNTTKRVDLGKFTKRADAVAAWEQYLRGQA